MPVVFQIPKFLVQISESLVELTQLHVIVVITRSPMRLLVADRLLNLQLPSCLLPSHTINMDEEYDVCIVVFCVLASSSII